MEAAEAPAGAASPAAEDGPESAGVSAAAVRGPELAVAAFLMVMAGLVIADSLRIGTGWADDGPRAGYFPFYIGLVLLAASGYVFASTLRHWPRLTSAFVMRHELNGVWAVFWPTLAYIALMPFSGLYVASALLIGFFMRRHGHYHWLPTLLVSLGVVIAFYLVFERWFLVPLPKGPLENLLGL